jgi:6-phosphogluconolactonase
MMASNPAVGDNREESTGSVLAYVGTYTGRGSNGIYSVRLDLASGMLSSPTLAGEIPNPSFLALSPDMRFLYACNEVGDFGGKKSGSVSAFAVQPDGNLTLLNRQPSGGSGPCYVSISGDGRYVLAANYGSGSVAALPVSDDGSLREPSSSIQHEGSSVDPKRQKGPHAHCVQFDPTGRFVMGVDLGLDKIMIYAFDAGKLVPNDPPHASAAEPGAGPRHIAFHPDGKRAYVCNEMGNTVDLYDYDSGRGALNAAQTVSTLPAGDVTTNTTAEVLVHPSGRFLYVSNRGHDSIAIFTLDAGSGRMTPAGHEPTQGKTPRNFRIDPEGRFLVAANQDSHTLVAFRIDQGSGKLEPTGSSVPITSPVCVVFAPGI